MSENVDDPHNYVKAVEVDGGPRNYRVLLPTTPPYDTWIAFQADNLQTHSVDVFIACPHDVFIACPHDGGYDLYRWCLRRWKYHTHTNSPVNYFMVESRIYHNAKRIEEFCSETQEAEKEFCVADLSFVKSVVSVTGDADHPPYQPPRVAISVGEEFDDWLVHRGRNTLTKKWDIFVSIPHKNAPWAMYRWSGKNQVWECHATVNIPNGHLAQYDKVVEVSRIEPDRTGVTVSRIEPDRTGVTAVKCVDRQCQCNQSKKGKFRMSLSKVFGKFGKCPTGDFAISLQGSVAVRRQDKGYSCLQDGKLVDVDTLVANVDAFYFLPVAPDQLAINDVVLVGTAGIGFVQQVSDAGIQVYDVNSEAVVTIKPATHVLMPTPFVTKVVSLLAPDMVANNPMVLMLLMKDGKNDMGKMLPLMLLMGQGGAVGGGGMNSMLPWMLMMDKDKDNDMSKMLPLMLLTQGQGGKSPMSPMLLMLLMQEGGTDDLLPLMLMGGGLGGLGAVAEAAAAAPAKKGVSARPAK